MKATRGQEDSASLVSYFREDDRQARKTLCPSVKTYHRIRPLSLSQQQKPAEEQVIRGHDAGDIAGADVVHVDAAAFDVFSCLAVRGTEAGVDEELQE